MDEKSPQMIYKLETEINQLKKELVTLTNLIEHVSNGLDKMNELSRDLSAKMNLFEFRLAQIEKTQEQLHNTILTEEKEFGENYVTKEQFDPIKTAIYSVVGLVITSVITAIIGLVVTKAA